MEKATSRGKGSAEADGNNALKCAGPLSSAERVTEVPAKKRKRIAPGACKRGFRDRKGGK